MVISKRLVAWILCGLLVVSVATAESVFDLRGNSYGQQESVLRNALAWTHIGLPFLGLLLLGYVYADSKSQLQSKDGRIMFIGGLALWGAILAWLLINRASSGNPTFLRGFLWYLLSSLIFVLPLGGWLLRRGRGWPKSWSTVSALVAISASAVVFAVAALAPVALNPEYGPLWGFCFTTLAMAFCFTSLARIQLWLWLVALASITFLAIQFWTPIFFAGIFYGGGMASPMLFVVSLILASIGLRLLEQENQLNNPGS